MGQGPAGQTQRPAPGTWVWKIHVLGSFRFEAAPSRMLPGPLDVARAALRGLVDEKPCRPTGLGVPLLRHLPVFHFSAHDCQQC